MFPFPRPQHRRPALEGEFGANSVSPPSFLRKDALTANFAGNELHRWQGVRTAHVWPITHAARAQLILFFLSDALAFVRLSTQSVGACGIHCLATKMKRQRVNLVGCDEVKKKRLQQVKKLRQRVYPLRLSYHFDKNKRREYHLKRLESCF